MKQIDIALALIVSGAVLIGILLFTNKDDWRGGCIATTDKRDVCALVQAHRTKMIAEQGR